MFDAIANQRIDLRGLKFEFSYYDIEELNARAINGEAEFSKISCAILPHISQNYTLSSSGAALGRGNGPLLVRRKGDRSPIRTIAIPGQHTTANLLIDKLFPQYKNRIPTLFSDIATAIERGDVDAGVLIHEGRFLYADRGLELIADLGLEWERRMSLPLPLGGIVMRNDIKSDDMDTFQSLLRESIEYAFAHPTVSREYIKSHAQELDDSVIEQHISLFVNEFSLDIGNEGAAAIDQLTVHSTQHN